MTRLYYSILVLCCKYTYCIFVLCCIHSSVCILMIEIIILNPREYKYVMVNVQSGVDLFHGIIQYLVYHERTIL